jgi:hypothetical protein
MDFIGFPKMARLSREVILTEKIDGTNAQIYIPESTETEINSLWNGMFGASKVIRPFLVGSRTRWITPEHDNFGFARWAYEHAEELMKLGPGHHYGEWWGDGIQRRYGLSEKRFSLFNVERWTFAELPSCVGVVPTLYRGNFDSNSIQEVLQELSQSGSRAAPGFMDPEGIVIWHTAAQVGFKKTIKDDEKPKGHAVTSL